MRADPFRDQQGAGSGYGYGGGNSAYGASKESLGGAPQKSAWMEGGKEPAGGSSWKRWAIIGGVTLLIVAGVAGGIAAWKITQNNSDSSGSSSAASGSGSNRSGAGQTVGSDPSVFALDARLKKSFYGMAYSPAGAILPNCGANLDDVILDIQLLSQLTPRIRTYGSDCNASYLTMEAIRQTKVDMQVYLGIYIDTDDTIWERQRDDTLAIVQEYGVDHIAGITVGNEFLLNQASGATTAPASAYTSITTKVAEMKTALAALSLSKTIPVGTADAGSMITSRLGGGVVDYAMANVHPWFGGLNINQAAGWTWEYMEEQVIPNIGTTRAYIAETGWPTNAMNASALTFQGAVAGVPELQTFLDTYVCQANANQSAYFYFEPKDEPWKRIYGGVEPYWGLFDEDRNLKDVTIPDCPPGDY